jgi:hypothetical protein
VVAYVVMTSGPSTPAAAESAPVATEQPPPAAAPPVIDDMLPEDTDLPVPRPAPSAVTSAQPRTGPPSQAWSSSSGATAPLLPTGPARVPAAASSNEAIGPAPDISPPPVNVELALPKLPGADSLVPLKAQRDTAAIKRILKAVGAGGQ